MMTNEEYVQGALRTESCDYEVIGRRAVKYIRELHAAMGLVTEAAEVLDMLKKAIFYGKEFDRVNVIEETGDAFWYCSIMADAQGFTFEQAQIKNISKLMARYPEKFCETKAVDRDLEKERSILEGRVEANESD